MILFFLHLIALTAMVWLLENSNASLLLDMRKKRIVFFVAMGYLAVLAMFRAASVGKDTEEYIAIFYRVVEADGLLEALTCSGMEKGYLFFNWLVSCVTSAPQWILILSSGFVFVCFAWFFNRYSHRPWISVFLFFALVVFDFCLSGIRQSIAIAVMLLGFDALLEQKPIRFVIFCLAASLFHATALLWLVVYPLVVFIRNSKIYFTLLVAGGAAAFLLCDIALRAALLIFPKYAYYLGGSGFESSGILAVTLRMMVYAAVLLFGACIYHRYPKSGEETVVSAMPRVIAFLIPVCFMALRVSVFSRFFVYFEPFICVYLSNLIGKIGNKKERTICLCTILAVSALYAAVIQLFRTPAWQLTYPYAFFW